MPQTARQILQGFLEEYGLGSLADWAWTLYTTSGAGSINDFVNGQLTVELPQTAAFKARFPAYERLRQAGAGISVEQYRQYEKDLADVAHTYGLPMAMLEDREYVATLMTNGVSAREFEQRAAINREAAYNAPQEVKAQLRAMYGVADVDGALTAYYLDPDRAVPILQQQFQSAQIAGAAIQQNLAIDQATAERLAKQGISWKQAQAGFRDVAATAGLASGFGDTVGQATQVAGAFGDQAAASEVKRVQKARQGGFQGGGGLAEQQSGVSGLGSASR